MSFILVVDGDPVAGQEIADLLGGVGFEARIETSGEDALAVASERSALFLAALARDGSRLTSALDLDSPPDRQEPRP